MLAWTLAVLFFALWISSYRDWTRCLKLSGKYREIIRLYERKDNLWFIDHTKEMPPTMQDRYRELKEEIDRLSKEVL